MSSRPAFVSILLDRPLPTLRPAKLTDANNPPYSKELQAQIADLHCHPLLESVLHLLNDDLFSAHFLLRKLQEDDWGKWLHAILHQIEGDLDKNAKSWYKEVNAKVLATFWGPKEPNIAAVRNTDMIMRIKAGDATAEEELQARKSRWRELVSVLEYLEKKFGYERVEGTTVYTRDETESHKSRILGEGYRRFDGSGYRV